MIAKPSQRSGFSLIEVTLAMGIVAFAFVSILGLLPVALTTFNRSIDFTVETQIAQRLFSDAQQVKFSLLNTTAGGSFFDDEGNFLISGTTPPAGGFIYHAVVNPPTTTLINNAYVKTVTINIAKNRTVDQLLSSAPREVRSYSFIIADVGI